MQSCPRGAGTIQFLIIVLLMSPDLQPEGEALIFFFFDARAIPHPQGGGPRVHSVGMVDRRGVVPPSCAYGALLPASGLCGSVQLRWAMWLSAVPGGVGLWWRSFRFCLEGGLSYAPSSFPSSVVVVSVSALPAPPLRWAAWLSALHGGVGL
jgi:hypothetical protein